MNRPRASRFGLSQVVLVAAVAAAVGSNEALELRRSRVQEPFRRIRTTQTAAPKKTTFAEETLSRAEQLARRAVVGLVALQDRDGRYRLGNAENPAPVAVTALSTLALLAMGEIPRRTPQGLHVERGLRYLLDQQDLNPSSKTYGYIANEEDDKYSKMHGHGYATLALAEAYGMLQPHADALVTDRELKTALIAAVGCIERSQDETGGWYYDPTPVNHENSITICVVQALRAAKNSGIKVDADVIARAVRYVERTQKPDGSFRYQLGNPKTSIALTAAGVATLLAAGQYDDPAVEKGRRWLLRRRPILEALRSERQGQFPFYERLYLAQAFFFDRDLKQFRRFYTRIFEPLQAAFDPATGRWRSHSYGDAYATAMTVLVLAMPLRMLPIHQR